MQYPPFLLQRLCLYSRAAAAHAREHAKSIWPFIKPALVGGGVFFLSIHFWQWLEIIASQRFADLVPSVVAAALHEITVPVSFVGVFKESNPEIALENWLHDEFVRIGGSFYKLTSLYPKLFLFLVLGGFAQYLFRPEP